MDSELGAWLRQQREDRGWTKSEMARQLIEAGHAAGDTAMPSLDGMCHNVHRWERGQRRISERHKLHYCRALGIHPASSAPRQRCGTTPRRPSRRGGSGRRLPACQSWLLLRAP